MAEMSLQGTIAYRNGGFSGAVENATASQIANKKNNANPLTKLASGKSDEATLAEQIGAENQELKEPPKVDKAEISGAKDNQNINEVTQSIIDRMKESVSKLSNPDEDRAAVDKELSGLQEELGKFVSGYNDALRFAQSSSNTNVLNAAKEMVTRTASVKDTLGALNINVEEDNSLKQLVEEQSKKQEEVNAALANTFHGGNYSYAQKTMKSVMDILGA
ncbi:MAG: hypothetical protein LBL80_00820 [Ruminococcus sp.]|jgi:hypothetical protein|nr:hypothetical protein [Ruminococcus sp.]